MQPTTDTDYKQLFSQLIKKQMLILGPDITMAKVRNVAGLTVDAMGEVQKIEGDPQVMLQGLINQFVELSGMIVKKTMESILSSYPGMAGIAAGTMAMAATTTAMGGGVQAVTQPQVIAPPVVVGSDLGASVASPIPTDIPSQTQNPALHDEIPKSSSHIEPPSMTAMNLSSLVPSEHKNTNTPAENGPASFTSQEMADLNKALEDLSKAPLSTEAPVSQTGVSQQA